MGLKDLQYKTSVFTGTQRGEKAGESLAKLVVGSANTLIKAGQLIEDERTKEERDAERRRRAEERAKNLSDKEKEDEDFILKVEYDTRFEEWQDKNDYKNLTASEKRVLTDDFRLQNEPFYNTEKYDVKHKFYDAQWNKQNTEERQIEQDTEAQSMAMLWASKNLNLKNVDGGQSIEEQILDVTNQLGEVSKKFTVKDMYKHIVDSAMNEINSDTTGKFRGMSGSQFEEYFSSVSAIKDPDIKKDFTAKVNETYLYDLSEGGKYLSTSNIDAVSRKTGLKYEDVYEKVKELNKNKINVLIKGDAGNIATAISILDTFPEMDRKSFIAENNQRAKRGDVSFYNYTKDYIQYPEETHLQMVGLELIAVSNGWDLNNPEDAIMAGKTQEASMSTSISINEKELNEEFTSWIDMSEDQQRYYRTNLKQAMKLASNKDEVFSILQDAYSKQEVDGIPIRGYGIQNSEQLTELKKYFYESASGGEEAEIKQVGSGFKVTWIDSKGVEQNEMLTRNDMKRTVNDFREYSSAKKTIFSIVDKSISDLTPTERNNAAKISNAVDSATNRVLESQDKLLNKSEKKKLKIEVLNKYSELIDEAKANMRNKNVNALGTGDSAEIIKPIKKFFNYIFEDLNNDIIKALTPEDFKN